MTERQAHILKAIVTRYIHSYEPVGSQFFVDESDLSVSGATVRNEMRELEEHGYLTHPHTSAGRIPTELGYQYYLEHLMDELLLPEEVKDIIENSSEIKDTQGLVTWKKHLAKIAAGWTGTAVIVGINDELYYYTGLSSLFSQPEFQDNAKTVDMSSLFDQCEIKIPEMMASCQGNNIHAFLGSQNPLGTICGTVAMVIEGEPWLFIGPMRMHYDRCLAMSEHIKSLIT